MNPLTVLNAEFKEGAASGLIYQLNESLGVIKISKVKELTKNLSKRDKQILTNYGVKIGELCIWVPKLFENKHAERFWCLRQIYFAVKNRVLYPDINYAISLKSIPKEFLYAREFILIGDSFYNVALIEKIILKFKSIMKSTNIFFLNKKNMNLFNKNFNLRYYQLKTILYTLGCKRDKNNPVKYILKNNKEISREFLVKNNKNINSPFSVLEKLTIN